MPDETPRDKTDREQEEASKKDLPPKPVDKKTSEQVKGGGWPRKFSGPG